MPEVDIGALADFPDGRGTPMQVGNRRLAIFRIGEQVYAIDDHCPHRGFPLHDGPISETTVRCRTHGSCFDLATGEVLRGPAKRGPQSYRIWTDTGRVLIDVL